MVQIVSTSQLSTPAVALQQTQLTPRATAWVRGMALQEDHTGQIMVALQRNMYVSIDDIAFEDQEALTALVMADQHIATLPPGVRARLRRALADLKITYVLCMFMYA